MIHPIPQLPENMVGFRASDEVTREDFQKVVAPEVDKLVEKSGKLNYMLVLDTSVKNFTLGAWFEDAFLGLRNMTKWNRTAIVTDSDSIKKFTDFFSLIMPGEFRAFSHSAIGIATDWVSERIDLK